MIEIIDFLGNHIILISAMVISLFAGFMIAFGIFMKRIDDVREDLERIDGAIEDLDFDLKYKYIKENK